MPSDDIEYYRLRQRQELLAADNSIDDYCRTIHLDLARLYGMRITELEADFSGFGDGDGFFGPSPSTIVS